MKGRGKKTERIEPRRKMKERGEKVKGEALEQISLSLYVSNIVAHVRAQFANKTPRSPRPCMFPMNKVYSQLTCNILN
jgi:hypothetical protein